MIVLLDHLASSFDGRELSDMDKGITTDKSEMARNRVITFAVVGRIEYISNMNIGQ